MSHVIITKYVPRPIRIAAETVAHPHVRHKALFFTAYSIHLILEHVAPESSGAFYYIIDVLHVFM